MSSGILNACIKSQIFIFWLLAVIATILSIVAPYLEFQRIAIAQDIYQILRLLCHQIPSRCFWIWDSNLGLCSRCFCLFASFSLGIPVFFLLNKRLKRQYLFWFSVLLIIPIIVDGTISTVTKYMSNNIIRSVTGTLYGVGFCLIINIKKGKPK
ncbi:MAG: DUF2085 domain-containing protein [Candidatus Brocadia sp.]|jgi:uncharacterized membrane protein